MARARKAESGQQPQEPAQDQAETSAPDAQAPGTAANGYVAAPDKAGDAFTIDNRIGYRKEVSADGRKRQIRFADRPDGGRPDDELLAPVREQKPAVSWAAKEAAWQARRTPEGLEAIDTADQKLREIGQKRTRGPER